MELLTEPTRSCLNGSSGQDGRPLPTTSLVRNLIRGLSFAVRSNTLDPDHLFLILCYATEEEMQPKSPRRGPLPGYAPAGDPGTLSPPFHMKRQPGMNSYPMHICLFDIDGTLVSSGGAGKAAMEAALQTEFAATAGADGVSFSGRTDRGILRDLFARNGIEETPDNARRFLASYLEHLPRTLASHPGKVLAGVGSLLARLHVRNDVWIGLLTGNVREGARLKLSHFEIFHYFRAGGFGDAHFHRDDVAREAMAELHTHLPGRVNPDCVWVIGDTPLDVQCARAIGARVAAVATGWHPVEELATARPDLLLSDLSDPAPLLERLN
jgi:phosphoglycolate phosphatase